MKHFINIFTLIFAIQTASSYGAVWPITLINNDVILSSNVTEFIEQQFMTDAIRHDLFKESTNYPEYIKKKKKWLQTQFVNGAKQLIYAHALEYDHKIQFGMKRVAFTTTSQEFYKKLSDFESTALGNKTKLSFAEALIEQGYPHKEEDSLEDIYNNWFETKKRSIHTNLWLREVAKYELFISYRGFDPKSHEVMMAPTRMYQKLTKELKESSARKGVNLREFSNIVLKKPVYRLVLKSVGQKTLAATPLNDFAKSDKISSYLKREVRKLAQSKRIKEIVDYAHKTDLLLNRYESINKLDALARKHKEMFEVDESNLKALIMSLLYSLAKEFKTLKTSSSDYLLFLNSTQSKVKLAITEIIKKVTNNEEKQKKLTFVELSTTILNSYFKKSYQKKVEKLISDLVLQSILFEFKKIALNHPGVGQLKLEFIDFADCWKKLQEHKKQSILKQNLTNYYDEELRPLLRDINLSIDLGKNENDQPLILEYERAINFLLD